MRLSITVLFCISLMLLTFFLEKGVIKENDYGIHPENMKLCTHSSLKTYPQDVYATTTYVLFNE
ncbi:MAG: hypothetical protein ACQEQO_08380 [Thermodesulfobacteriota bacterium]